MREAYRLQKNSLREHLVQTEKTMAVFFLYQGKELPDYAEVYGKIGMALKRLIKFSHENN